MTEVQPLITIAICSYNRRAYLEDTLKDVNAFQAKQGDAEVVVINNNSTDDTAAMLEGFKWTSPLALRTFIETKQGLSHARNRAIDEARAPYVLFLDDDIYAEPEFLSLWLANLQRHPQLTGAGGRIKVHFDGENPHWFPPIIHSILGHHYPYRKAKPYTGRAYPFGGNMLIKKEWFSDHGNFNPELGRKGKVLGAAEEKDIFTQMKSENAEIWFFPECLLKHRIGTSRLSKDYVMRQGFGLGAGDRIRCESARDTLDWNVLQTVKVIGTIAYASVYLLTGRFAAASVLIQFRYHLVRGFYTRPLD